MSYANFVRGLVKKNPDLKLRLKKANSKLSPFQYVSQSIMMTLLSLATFFLIGIFAFKQMPILILLFLPVLVVFSPVIYNFWIRAVDVQITKYGREIDSDLLFVSEYILVSLESGMPLGNAIENLSKLNRPGGRFFKRIYTEFKTGKSLEDSLEEGSLFSASDSVKLLIKRLKDSISIGVDLRQVLENFILESSDKKMVEIQSFSKKLNPIIMMYLLLGIVMPSLGVTFFMLAATMLEMTPALLKITLFGVFLFMFMFQYFAYTSFKFKKATL